MKDIIRDCDTCRYKLVDTRSFPCNSCPRNYTDRWEPVPKQTNADRIRSMTDEELAKIITCPYAMGNDCQEFSEMVGSNCIECCKKWLHSEVEENET